jgi:DNA polymerase I-like protein with 3'-5' exonuclease and polymerase domains
MSTKSGSNHSSSLLSLKPEAYLHFSAFCAAEGNSLIVADYSQLEVSPCSRFHWHVLTLIFSQLRILAHVTKCQSMIEAFEKVVYFFAISREI